MPYGVPNTNPALLAAIRRAPKEIQAELLATTWAESGGRLDAVGDGGESHGAYQEYTHGRGAGLTPAQRRDPVGSTQRASREFMQYYNKGMRGGELAVSAQRPANRSAYVSKINSYLDDARAVLGQSAGAGVANGLSPETVKAQNESPNPGGNGLGLEESIATSLAGRKPGQSLFQTVFNGVMATTVGSGAVPQRQGVTANPQGNGPGGTGEPGAVGAAKRWLGTPYSWGGGSPSGPGRGFAQGANTVGFDCSSLVQYAWSKMGVSLPRTTYDQIKTGVGINAANPAAWRPGDLLFPSTGHVQMYVGNGKIIEAPRTGGHVQIVPARSSYIAVRRPR